MKLTALYCIVKTYLIVILLLLNTLYLVRIFVTQTSHEPINNNNNNKNIPLQNKESPYLNTEPVLFEPIRNIKLSRATYKVSSYIKF